MYKIIIEILVSSIITFILTIFLITSMKTGVAEIVSDYNGTNVGIIETYSGTTIPEGYLLCDGRAISRTTYSKLFSVIGTTYGAGDGSTTFNLPNIAGKVAVGKDESDFTTLGQTGGSVNSKLTTSNLPSHSHTVTPTGTIKSTFTGTSATTSNNGSHFHRIYRPVWYLVDWTGFDDTFFTPYDGPTTVKITDTVDSGGAHTHTITPQGTVSSTFTGNSGTTSSVGNGTSFTNLQPYIVINYIIKY